MNSLIKMDVLPKELILHVGLYLNDIDFSNYLETVPYFLGTSDYMFLIFNKYPGYYKQSVNKYDVGLIYKSLLEIENCINERIKKLSGKINPQTGMPYASATISTLYINTYIVIINYISNSDVTSKIYLYELYKYLHMEGFASFNEARMDPVYQMDDLDTFIIFETKRNVNETNPKYYAIDNNSYKILEYLLQKDDRDEIKEFLVELYYNFLINLDITKLLFKYLELSDNEIFDIILQSNERNEESIEYMLTKVDIDDIQTFLNKLIGFYDDRNIVGYSVFKKVWNIYKNKLTDKQVIEIFDAVTTMNMDDGSTMDWKKTILLLSQHPAVIKKYLDL